MIGEIYGGLEDKHGFSFEGIFLGNNYILIIENSLDSKLRIFTYARAYGAKKLNKSYKEYFDLLFLGKIDYDDFYDYIKEKGDY